MELLRLQYKVAWKEFAEVDRFFIVSKEVLENLKPLYEKLLPTIRKEIKDQFSSEGKPDKWKALSPIYLASYKKSKSKYSMKILKLTGKMWKAATKRGAAGNICSITNDGLIWGVKLSEIPYARLHDKGGKIGGRVGGIMPQREFLKLTKEGVKRIVQKAHRFIRSQMKSGTVGMK